MATGLATGLATALFRNLTASFRGLPALPATAALAALGIGLAIGAAACGSSSDATQSESLAANQATAVPSDGDSSDGNSSGSDSAEGTPGATSDDPSTSPPSEPVNLSYEVVAIYPHDKARFTQGLEYFNGKLYESTGIVGESSLLVNDLSQLAAAQRCTDGCCDDGCAEAELSVLGNPDHFGEGFTRVGDRIIWLTWRAGIATSYDIDTFEPLGTFGYEGEGWGLCHSPGNHKDHLIKSDGTNKLKLLTEDQLLEAGEVIVADFYPPSQTEESRGSNSLAGAGAGERQSASIDRLNELECVDELVWANVWQSDVIFVIDPGVDAAAEDADAMRATHRGEVVAVADMSGLISPHPAAADADAVLNGIAYRPDTDTFLITGKRWPAIYEVRFDTEAISRRGR